MSHEKCALLRLGRPCGRDAAFALLLLCERGHVDVARMCKSCGQGTLSVAHLCQWLRQEIPSTSDVHLLAVCGECRGSFGIDPALLRPYFEGLAKTFEHKYKRLPDPDKIGILYVPIDDDRATRARAALMARDAQRAATPIPTEIVREEDLSPEERAALRG